MGLTQFLSQDFEKLPFDNGDFHEELHHKKILITGATGFVGKWILYYLSYLHNSKKIVFEVLALSRDPELFLHNHPEIKNAKFINWAKCDIEEKLDLDFKPDYVLHMATDVSKIRNDHTSSSLEKIIKGTKNLLSYIQRFSEKKIKMLYLSSGAIYGLQPSDIKLISEGNQGILNPLASEDFYGESKRICENLCSLEMEENSNFHFCSARCFSFSGPFLPLKSNFALGNFIGSFLQEQDLEVTGSGLDKRSYLYGADMAHWLLKILIMGECGEAYNVGSDQIVTIKELAEMIVSLNSKLKINILNKNVTSAISQYVPSIKKADVQLNLKNNFSTQYGIKRMLQFQQKFREFNNA